MEKYKCITGLVCACGKEFAAVLQHNSPPDRIGGIDGTPADLGETLYFHYYLACPKCGRIVVGIVPARDLEDDIAEEKSKFKIRLQINGEMQDVPVYFNAVR